MENIIQFLCPSNVPQAWGQATLEKVPNLEVPCEVSAFSNPDKTLCSSGVDLVCSFSSTPCSG